MTVDPDFARAIIQNIGLRWSKEELCDIKITVGEKVFACSQFHLCACSEFFDVLLHPGPLATKTTQFPEIKITGISPNIFSLVLNAIFKGENYINAYNMIELWYAANHLQINFLIQKCETFIADQVTVDNCLNIYLHALCLRAEFVLKKIMGIMTSNFEQLRHTQIFLDMSSQTLLKLIERKDYQSYDSVIDFIIQWAGNEDDNKKDSICIMLDTNVGEDSQQCINDRGDTFVEVIFRNDMLHDAEVVTPPMKRKDLLGTLMTHAQLNQVSNKGLKMLLGNDLVMDNREARNAVRKALDLVLETENQVTRCSKTTIKASENKTETPMNSFDKDDSLEPVVLFMKDRVLNAYTILTKQYFMINIGLQFDDILIYNNQIYGFSKYIEYNTNQIRFFTISEDRNIDYFHNALENHANSKLIYNDSFLYSLRYSGGGTEILRMKYTQKIGTGIWTKVGTFDVSFFNLIAFTNLKTYILAFYYDVKDNNEVYILHYFHTLTRMSDSKIAVWGRLNCNYRDLLGLVTFSFNERLFVLCGNGNLTEILEKDGDLECESHLPLWDFYISLYGAAVFDQTLYIFTDIKTKETLPTACQFGSIQFVQFLTGAGNCHFMKVYQDWFTTEL